MAIAKPQDIERYLVNPSSSVLGIYLHGPNQGLVKDIAARVAKTTVGSLDDPFNLIYLSENQLKEAPGLLCDEMLAISFTGERKVIWIKETGPAFTKQLIEFLANHADSNLLIVENGNVKKTAAIRKFFDSAKNCFSIACYEESILELTAFIGQIAKDNDTQIDNSTISFLIQSVGTNRDLLRREMEKLISFGLKSKSITTDDVISVCDDPIMDGLNDLCDLVFTGNLQSSLVQFQNLIAAGTDPSQLLNTLATHLHQIGKYRNDTDLSGNLNQAMRSARPPIFFKRQNTIKLQVSIWHKAILQKAGIGLFEAIALARTSPDLAPKICERVLINLCKSAQTGSR